MDIRSLHLPFRVGTTSYIVEDDLLPNARFLSPVVQDMQLVLFDVAGGPSNLPTPATVQALAAHGRAHDLSYTVHLIHDLKLDPGAAPPGPALRMAQQVVDLTRSLHPWAYVAHLDGRALAGGPVEAAQLAAWQAQAAAAVEHVAAWLPTSAHLAIENLEGFAPELVTPVAARTGAGRCLDVGHLWLDGHAAVPALHAALPRLRVVHLHAVAGRDHASLQHAAPAALDALLDVLLAARFGGVVTLEVFGESDFWSSLDALHASIARLRATRKGR